MWSSTGRPRPASLPRSRWPAKASRSFSFDPARHVGGMVSGGLGATDTGKREAIGGYSPRVLRPRPRALRHELRADIPAGEGLLRRFSTSSRTSRRTSFADMLREAKIEPRLDQPFDIGHDERHADRPP